MASLGTIFVELQLDDKIYKQKLSETLTSVQATAKGIETSWKALGTKSDAYFEAQRRSADNAYALIKNSAVSTTQDIIRAEQAKNAKIDALNKQQFGKHETLLQSLKNNWMIVTAGIAAAYASMSGVIGFIKNMANAYGEEERAVSKLSFALAAHGVMNKEVAKIYSDYAHQLQNTTTFSAEATMQAMQLLTTMGTAPAMIKPATEAVLSLSYAYGIDLPQAAKMVGQAMEGNFKMMQRFIPALKGVQVGAMDAAQVLDIIQQYTGNIAAKGVDTYIGKLKMLTNAWGELKEQIGSYVVPALKTLIDITLSGIHVIEGLFGVTSLAWKKKELEIIKKQIAEIDSLIEQEDDSYQSIHGGILDINVEMAKRNALLERQIELELNIIQIEKTQNKTLEAANDNYIKSQSHLLDELQKKIRQEIEKTLADRKKYESTFYEWKVAVIEASLREYKQAGINETRIAELKTEKIKTLHAEMFKDYKKILADWEKDTHEKSRKTAEEMQKSSQEALTSYAEMYKGIKVRSLDLYEIQIELIEQQKEAFIRATNDQVAAEAWAMEQRAQKWIEYAQTTDDVMLGIKAGLVEMQRNLYTFGKAGYDMFKSFAQSSQNVISSVLFDGMKRQLKSFHDYWKSFTDALLKTFVDIVARMVVEWTTAQIFMSQMSFAGGFAGGAGLAVGSATGAGAGYGLTTAGLAGGAYMLTPGAVASTAYSGAQISSFAATIPDAAILAAQTGQTVGVIGTNYAVTSAGETIAAAQATMPATAGWMAMASPYLAAAGIGYLGGSLIGGAIFGEEHAQSSGIGAALGATAGMFIGGPVGAVIGGALGGVVGGLFHEGGIVGESLVPQRQVPALAFAGAPRAHYGLGIDEVPIIAQRGERILSRRVTAEYESGASNRPIYLTLELDGKVLSRWMYKESKSGQNLIHVRGIVDK